MKDFSEYKRDWMINLLKNFKEREQAQKHQLPKRHSVPPVTNIEFSRLKKSYSINSHPYIGKPYKRTDILKEST